MVPIQRSRNPLSFAWCPRVQWIQPLHRNPHGAADTHQVHRWVHSSPMDSGIQSQMALRGKSPRWHMDWRHRRVRLQNQIVSRAVPTKPKQSSPSPQDPESTRGTVHCTRQ